MQGCPHALPEIRVNQSRYDTLWQPFRYDSLARFNGFFNPYEVANPREHVPTIWACRNKGAYVKSFSSILFAEHTKNVALLRVPQVTKIILDPVPTRKIPIFSKMCAEGNTRPLLNNLMGGLHADGNCTRSTISDDSPLVMIGVLRLGNTHLTLGFTTSIIVLYNLLQWTQVCICMYTYEWSNKYRPRSNKLYHHFYWCFLTLILLKVHI